MRESVSVKHIEEMYNTDLVCFTMTPTKSFSKHSETTRKKRVEKLLIRIISDSFSSEKEGNQKTLMCFDDMMIRIISIIIKLLPPLL